MEVPERVPEVHGVEMHRCNDACWKATAFLGNEPVDLRVDDDFGGNAWAASIASVDHEDLRLEPLGSSADARRAAEELADVLTALGLRITEWPAGCPSARAR